MSEVNDIQVLVPLYKPDENGWAECEKSLQEHFPAGEVLVGDDTETGWGFTRNVNDLVSRSNAQFLFLLNQDTVIHEGTIRALRERFNLSPNAGIVSAQIRDLANPKVIQFGGGLECWPAGRHKSGYADYDLTQPTREKWLSFVAVMIKTDVFRDIGLLDPRMKNIFSDSDFCLRARTWGYECWYEPASVVLHAQYTSKEDNPQHKYDYLAFTEKWLGGGLYNELMREVV